MSMITISESLRLPIAPVARRVRLIFRPSTIALLILGLVQPVMGGNRGQVSLSGWGQIEADLVKTYRTETDKLITASTVAKNPSTGVSSTATVQFPSAGDTYGTFPPPGYAYGGVRVLPPSVVSTVQSNTLLVVPVPGGYGGKINQYLSGGTSGYNEELDELFGGVPPALVVFSDLEVQIVSPNPMFPQDPLTGVFKLTGSASAGSAFSFIGYEIETDYSAGAGPTREELLVNGKLIFKLELMGPFSYSENCPLYIPFRYKGDPDKLVMITDALGKSEPFEVQAIEDQTYSCGETILYPESAVISGGVGTITWTYEPKAEDLVLGPNEVTLTAMDSDGNIAVRTFIATVADLKPPVLTLLGDTDITLECGSSFVDPGATALDDCDGDLTSFIVRTGGVVATTSGTYSIYYNVSDLSGNPATPLIRTVTVVDRIAPMPAVESLPTITIECHSPGITLTPPTAFDSCDGVITGTTETPTISTPGTYEVVWTYTDTSGNSSSQTQTVIKQGLTFIGFDAPIGGEGGTCDKPLRTDNLGSKIPIKFSTLCLGAVDLGGARPTYHIEQCKGGSYSSDGVFQEVSNEWHANWLTDAPGVTPGSYKLTVTLQDGTTRFVYLGLVRKK